MSYTQRETPMLAALCTRLVEDVYGDLAARVYSVLARHGRQTLAAIARASYLSSRQIKAGLVILLQQHLVFHSAATAPVAYYEIDWQHSYAIVRFGKVAKLVADRLGSKAANVVANLLALGHTRVADLHDAYFPAPPDSDADSDSGRVPAAGSKRKRPGGPVNGHTESRSDQPDVELTSSDADIASPAELTQVLQDLIQRGWVRTATETQYLSPGDMHDMLTQEAIESQNGGLQPTGTKDKDLVLRETLRRKREMRDGWLAVPASFRPHTNGADCGPASKRVKINGAHGLPAGRAPADDEGNLVVRVNPEKIAVAMRTEQLVRLVEQRVGYVTSRIYRTMLRMVEVNTPRCYEEWPDPPVAGALQEDSAIDPQRLVTARDVAKHLDRDIDICQGLDPHAIVQITGKGHVRSSNVLSQPIDHAKLSLDERTRIVDKHMVLLSEDPFHFVTWHSRAGFSQWHIEFDEIAKQLIQTEVENTIAARKGTLGVKLIRALRKKGKLDERAACNAMMMSPNDIRGIINDLTVQGFVQTQEIPKVERREAKHSLHLVWYDRQRAREKLLHDTYKGMLRILERIAFERDKVQPVLSKAERSDVVGHEDKWLTQGELQALKKWKAVQEKLLLQLFREDDLVASLRDFHGPLLSA